MMAIAKYLSVFMAIVFAFGLPFNSLTIAFSLLALVVWVASSQARPVTRRGVLRFLGAMLILKLAQWSIPTFHADEGHALLILGHHTKVYEEGLPAPIYAKAKDIFDGIYDRQKACLKSSGPDCWLDHNPSQLYAPSSEGLWRPTKATRRVSEINFDSLRSLRISIINALSYDKRDLNTHDPHAGFDRDQTPFMVRYELNDTALGGTFCHSGMAYFSPNAGHLKDLTSQEEVCVQVEEHHLKGFFYGLSFPPHSPLKMSLTPESRFQVGAGLQMALSMVMIILYALFFFKVDLGLVSERFAVIALTGVAPLTLVKNVPEKFYQTIIMSWGDDGLRHQGYGIGSLLHALEGNFYEALRGGADVFYYMPGYRYLRSLEYLIFGDTNVATLLMVLVLPFCMYQVARLGAPRLFALGVTLLYCASVLDWASFKLATFNAYNGYADPIAFTMIFLVLYNLCQFMIRWESQRPPSSAFAFPFFCLAIATLMRPNLGMAAVMIVGSLAFFFYRQKQWAYLRQTLWLFPLGFCLVHNYIYSGRFVLTTSGSPGEIWVTPADYGNAFLEILGLAEGTGLHQVTGHLGLWLGDPYFLKITMFLVVGIFFLVSRHRFSWPHRLFLISLIGNHMYFTLIRYNTRYSGLAWMLLLIGTTWAITSLWESLTHRYPRIATSKILRWGLLTDRPLGTKKTQIV